MTTKIADIYDAINVKLAALMPTYARMANPYSAEDNPDFILKKAYGIAIGSGTNTQRYVGCFATWERTYTIGIIRQVVNTENDVNGKASVEKDLVDVHRAILLGFETDSSLSGIAIKAIVTDDTGIQYVKGVASNFLAIEIGLSVEYQESIT